MIYYLNTFLIYSFLGFCLETTMKTFFFKDMNNGFLLGPWIPIYGIGVCIIIVLMRLIFNRFKVNRITKIFLLFVISVLVLTLLELTSGHLIEMLTGKIFWDYSKLKFNIGHYIALEISIVWGIMSIVITYVIKPIVDKIIDKIPKLVTYSLLFIFATDFIYSIINSII